MVTDWSDSHVESANVFRRQQPTKAAFHELKADGEGCGLLAVKVQVLGKGTFAANSMICWPSDSDLNLILGSSGMELNGIQLDKSDLRPEERAQTDENSGKRKQLTTDHKKEKIQLRRKWKRIKEKLTRLRFDALEKPDQKALQDQIASLKKSLKVVEELRSAKNAEHKAKMETLLGLDDFDTVRGSTSRPVIGYLNMAGGSFRLGSKPLGLGYVSAKAHEQYTKYFNEKLGYKETGPKIKALKKHYGVCFDSLVIVLVRRANSERYSYALMEHVEQ